MTSLHSLTNSSATRKKSKRVGRGISSGKGKTCGRGYKGQGSRSGAKRRLGYEGGQFRTFMKLPIRGFSRARFQTNLDTVNLYQIDRMYQDGETVNIDTLMEKGFLSGKSYGLKILGEGELTKKVKIEAQAFTKSAMDKLTKANIEINTL
jgi:large subunit ribosomal protein L15